LPNPGDWIVENSREGTPIPMNRRQLIQYAGIGIASLTVPTNLCSGNNDSPKKKTHYFTLSFDDGFKNSSLLTAEIYEKHKLSACINVIATAHLPDFVLPNEYHRWPVGDFKLWNDLQSRGHEIMPHGYKHANKKELPLGESKDLIRRCLDYFAEHLKGFDPKKAVFNFPFNASTLQLEKWLTKQVMAFRTGGPIVNRLPHRGQSKLTCGNFGPGNTDAHLIGEIDKWLAEPSGWFIYNTHGLDDEGYGPLTASVLDRLLERLKAIPHVEIIPAARALLGAKGAS
jgi:peptidoglycan/xylan/chitin deacetylase (PgdA/CDA1 family)